MAIVIISTTLKTIGVISTTLWAVPLLLLAMLIFRNYNHLDPESKVTSRVNLHLEYDFVIIGGGSAGAVLANRLSEITNWTVLLLEAGPDENHITDVPSLAAYLQLSQLDWQYKIESSNRSCLGMKNHSCNWPRGKVLGGSSVLNYMLYVRGNRKDFDHWNELGNHGWSYDEVLPYFKKSEDNRNPYLVLKHNKHYHKTGGYLTVQESPWRTPLVLSFIEAAQELGYMVRDINGADQEGFMIAQGTIRRGSRCSTAKAFLRPIRLRPNLHISLESHVTKIHIDPITKKANLIEFNRNKKKMFVRVCKEVILSAGAINSPQLLMLSGVGPKHHLESLDIPVVQDLPVGENLQDHVGMGGLTFVLNKPFAIIQDRFDPIPMTFEYALNGKGPMTTLGGVEGLAFVRTKYANDSWPDIQFHMAPASINSDRGDQVKHVLGITDHLYDTVYKPIENKDTWTLIPLLLRPKSRGWIRLRSKNPYEYPIINANYFQHPIDIKILVEGAKIALKINNATPFRKLGSKLHNIPLPNCQHLKFASDKYLECHIRTISMTIYHASGSCKMAPRHDPYAVVDNRLRVYGIQNIRVIDASIMPTITSGNTNAPVIMIAEKGSDLIKEDWLN